MRSVRIRSFRAGQSLTTLIFVVALVAGCASSPTLVGRNLTNATALPPSNAQSGAGGMDHGAPTAGPQGGAPSVDVTPSAPEVTPYVVIWLLYATPTPSAPDPNQPTPYVVIAQLFGTPTPTPGTGGAASPSAPTQAAPTRAAATPTRVAATQVAVAATPTLKSVTSAQAGPTAPALATATRPVSAASKGDWRRGQNLFVGPGTCNSCHDVSAGVKIVGPSLKGVASRAGARKPPLTADEYIRESILTPNKFVVPGFQSGLMPQTFAQTLNSQQVDDLIAYLLTLK